MAEITIRLRKDPETGKHDIIIDMDSDADALPHEHENMHREAVEKILGKGSIGKVIITRDAEPTPNEPTTQGDEEREAQGNAG